MSDPDSDEDGFSTGLTNLSNSNKRWVEIVVPICALALFALVMLVLQRNRRRRLNVLALNQQGRQALERDMEEGWGARRSPPGDGYMLPRSSAADAATVQGGTNIRRSPRMENRWAWANSINLMTLSSTHTRPRGTPEDDLGLNELGEAPPPYDARKGACEDDRREGSIPVASVTTTTATTTAPHTEMHVTFPPSAHLLDRDRRHSSLDGDTITGTSFGAATTSNGTATPPLSTPPPLLPLNSPPPYSSDSSGDEPISQAGYNRSGRHSRPTSADTAEASTSLRQTQRPSQHRPSNHLTEGQNERTRVPVDDS